MLSLIPISDANPARRFPIVTLGLIAANIYAFFFLEPGFGQTAGAQLYFVDNAPIPCQLPNDCPPTIPGTNLPIPVRDPVSFLLATLLSIFLHGGWLHIIGNMLFLWIFGNNVEDHLGPLKYLGFYLLAGIVATLAHVFTHVDSFLPGIGASGAVAGVMGAYLVLYPRARINVLVPIFFLFTVVAMSAWLVLMLWFVYQFFIGAQEAAGGSGVAWMAHVGGFVFGAAAIILLGGRPQRPRPQWQPQWR